MRSLLLLFIVVSFSKTLGGFPPPTDFGATNTFGRNLQRSMRLANDSSPTQQTPVRVLLYGQSITASPWSVTVTDYLRHRYPNANLIITNLAISGFTSDLLVKTAEKDLYPFYPDLLIFQDYGPTSFYEQMIAEARLRTTTDILIQTDHPTLPQELTEVTDPAILTPADGTAWRNYSFLPEIARTYGVELGDIRTSWKNYLISNGDEPSQLLQDVIHPNAQGNYLMAQLIEPYFRADYSFADDTWKDAVKEIAPGDEAPWTNNTLVVPFTGNRIDVTPSRSGGAANFKIDGRSPEDFPELYSIGRASLYQDSVWPCVIGVAGRTPLLEEDWTATVLDFQTSPSGPNIHFSLSGSKTGFDGVGSSTNDFVSNSGRVVIASSDWMLGWGILQADHSRRGSRLSGVSLAWPEPIVGR